MLSFLFYRARIWERNTVTWGETTISIRSHPYAHDSQQAPLQLIALPAQWILAHSGDVCALCL